MKLECSNNYCQWLMLFFLLFPNAVLKGHGFAEDTAILLCDNTSTVYLYDLCIRIRKKQNPWCIASYDTQQAIYTHGKAVKAGRAITPAITRFTYHDDQLNIHSSVDCTPLQEFYVHGDTPTWSPAYRLKPRDQLFSIDGFCVVDTIENSIGKQIVYLIEIQDTHTFFVGKSGLLTHNMGLPYAVNVGLSISLGLAAGSSMGSFFGPVTLVAGAAIGSAIGIAAQIVCGNRLTEYKVGMLPEGWGDCLHLHETQASPNKNLKSNNNVDSPTNNKQPKKDNNNDKRVLEAAKGAKNAADKVTKDARDKLRNDWQPLTNKQAREEATKMGYREKRDPPFKDHGELTFYNEKDRTWISPDTDGHTGGVWKLMDRRGNREGTFNIDLTKKIAK